MCIHTHTHSHPSGMFLKGAGIQMVKTNENFFSRILQHVDKEIGINVTFVHQNAFNLVIHFISYKILW